MLLLMGLWSLNFILHSVLADLRVKRFFRRIMGNAYPWYRLIYNLISVIGFSGLLLLHIRFPSNLLPINHLMLMIFGGVLFLLGGCFGYLSIKNYDIKEFTGVQQMRQLDKKNADLIRSGLNRHVRHPLYFSAILVLTGGFFLIPTEKNLWLLLISFLYIYIGTLLEERKLILEFGASYRTYQREVKMLIPYVF
ncbi:MAG: isoprenylcysteine carboxylmethyltransferase family protein [Bacteroidota bacterium]